MLLVFSLPWCDSVKEKRRVELLAVASLLHVSRSLLSYPYISNSNPSFVHFTSDIHALWYIIIITVVIIIIIIVTETGDIASTRSLYTCQTETSCQIPVVKRSVAYKPTRSNRWIQFVMVVFFGWWRNVVQISFFTDCRRRTSSSSSRRRSSRSSCSSRLRRRWCSLLNNKVKRQWETESLNRAFTFCLLLPKKERSEDCFDMVVVLNGGNAKEHSLTYTRVRKTRRLTSASFSNPAGNHMINA